jgi:uncharacterized protein YkwD
MNKKIILIVLSAPFLLNFYDPNLSLNRSEELKILNLDFSQNPNGTENIVDISNGEELKMLNYINQLRKKKGLNTLKIDNSLMLAARYHSADMSFENYFDHDTYNSSDGELENSLETFARVRLFYNGGGYVNTENIAAGNNDAYGAFTQWVNSPGHYENMLNSNAKSLGVGYYYNENSDYGSYWTMDTATE